MAKTPIQQDSLQDLQHQTLETITGDEENDEEFGVNEEDEDSFDLDDSDLDFDNDSDEDDDDDEESLERSTDNDPDESGQDEPATDPVGEDDVPVDAKNVKWDENFYFKADKAGNLIDNRGRIMFASGQPRSIFERVKNAYRVREAQLRGAIGRMEKQREAGTELVERYKQLKASKNYAESLGLTTAEIKEASDLAAHMKADAKSGVQKLLTMLHMRGIDLSDIGVSGPIDPETVADLVYKRQKTEQEKQSETSQADAAQKEAMTFLEQNEDAIPHVQLVVEAKQRFPNMSLDKIWYEIKLSAARQQAKRAQSNQRRPEKGGENHIPRNGTRRQRPKQKGIDVSPVDPGTDWSDIKRGVLRDLAKLEER